MIVGDRHPKIWHSLRTIEGRIFERFDRVDVQDSGAQRSCLVLATSIRNRHN
jgi:hypothetical protein